MESWIGEKEHQLLLDAIKEHAIFMMDKDGYIISWNEGARRLKGFNEDDVIGEHYRVLFLPEDREGRPEHGMKMALNEGKFEEEWWRVKKDGSKFWAHVILQPIYDENKIHIGYAKITTDKTQQRRVDELNTFLMNEVAGYAIFLLDKNRKIAKWNKAAQMIFGYGEREILGKSMAIFDTSDKNIHTVIDKLFNNTNGKFESEGWSKKKDGSHFWASFIVSPLHNGDGFVVLLRDLTEQKAHDQTLKTNIALTASNTELERFAYVASHDLKEPIRKISTYCHLLKSETPHQATLIERIVNACTRVSTLIEDLLKFATLSGTHVFEKQDLNILLRNTLDSISEVIKEKQAVVECDKLPTVRVIPSQIEQLFQNLITNAIKFCCAAPKTPRVAVRNFIIARQELAEADLSRMFPAERYLRLEVEDNGIGFSQQFSDSIFQLFHRLHEKNQFDGTGVGLSICKKVVENHGGIIKAFSKEGEGALFVITLPYAH
ncbi:sensor histidine kinase [Chryseosolibacter indicus]|uniref:histidine kinase n=1 Tax=Chryseosolibacter indicus TaxID=2782351 RepID=A0ABS5VVT4_9BACT|nr:PAS domain-containing sensor histidine kinase [Chryseosolibacter indicus]MBT1704930.1 PAS domain S-box protein [Chryseosolibacter indicus]